MYSVSFPKMKSQICPAQIDKLQLKSYIGHTYIHLEQVWTRVDDPSDSWQPLCLHDRRKHQRKPGPGHLQDNWRLYTCPGSTSYNPEIKEN